MISLVRKLYKNEREMLRFFTRYTLMKHISNCRKCDDNVNLQRRGNSYAFYCNKVVKGKRCRTKLRLMIGAFFKEKKWK